MLAAYRGQLPDTVPVAPEFWYYVPAKLLGVDMVTFEREAPLWEALGGRVTFNGNVHTVETLIWGTPADVRREVEGILDRWGPDRRRLILGTGD